MHAPPPPFLPPEPRVVSDLTRPHVNVALDILNAPDEIVSVQEHDGRVVLVVDMRMLTLDPLRTGEYKHWQRINPESGETTVDDAVEEAVSALRWAMLRYPRG